MENYFARLLLTNELEDPVHFAKVHQNLFDLEKKRIAHFNQYGPMNETYVSLMGELNMAYLAVGDTANELEAAQQMYRTDRQLYGEHDERTIASYLALGHSYLDDGQVVQASSIACELSKRTRTGLKPPISIISLEVLSFQADIHHLKQEFASELELRQQVFARFTELFGSTDSQSIISRTALAICLERLRRFSLALDHYLVVHSYLDSNPDFVTEAEKIGLLVHIGRCYRRLGHFEDSRVIYRWAYSKAQKQFGPSAPLTVKMKKLMKVVQSGAH